MTERKSIDIRTCAEAAQQAAFLNPTLRVNVRIHGDPEDVQAFWEAVAAAAIAASLGFARGGAVKRGKPHVVGEVSHCQFAEIVARRVQSVGPRAPGRTDIIG